MPAARPASTPLGASCRFCSLTQCSLSSLALGGVDWTEMFTHNHQCLPQNMCASFQRQWCNTFDNQENHKSLESQQLLSSKTSTCSVAGGDAKSPAAWVKISGFGLDFVTSERTRWPMTSRTSWKNSPKNSGWIWEADRLISKISGTRPGLQ